MTELALRFIDVVDTTRLVERLGDARAAQNEAQTVVVALGAGGRLGPRSRVCQAASDARGR